MNLRNFVIFFLKRTKKLPLQRYIALFIPKLLAVFIVRPLVFIDILNQLRLDYGQISGAALNRGRLLEGGAHSDLSFDEAALSRGNMTRKVFLETNNSYPRDTHTSVLLVFRKMFSYVKPFVILQREMPMTLVKSGRKSVLVEMIKESNLEEI